MTDSRHRPTTEGLHCAGCGFVWPCRGSRRENTRRAPDERPESFLHVIARRVSERQSQVNPTFQAGDVMSIAQALDLARDSDLDAALSAPGAVPAAFALLASLAEEHHRDRHSRNIVCWGCRRDWPCPTGTLIVYATTLLRNFERLTEENERLREIAQDRLRPLCATHGVVPSGHRCRDFNGMSWEVERLADLLD